MLRQRLLVAIVLLPLFILLIAAGGLAYDVLIIAALGVAAWEYWRLFKLGGYTPSPVVLIGGVLALAIARAATGFEWTPQLITAVVLLAMAVEVLDCRGQVEKAATNFTITVAGVFYLGWLGAYLISVRSLPDGQWWTLLVLPAIMFANSAAFSFGRRFGHTPLAPRISPKKTWEGYLSGVAFSALFTALLGMLWGLRAPVITPGRGLLLGVTLAVVSPLGDLGESMIKRQFGVKDSSRILPGHGGIMDRIDTWIWAAAIGFYLIGLWI